MYISFFIPEKGFTAKFNPHNRCIYNFLYFLLIFHIL